MIIQGVLESTAISNIKHVIPSNKQKKALQAGPWGYGHLVWEGTLAGGRQGRAKNALL